MADQHFLSYSAVDAKDFARRLSDALTAGPPSFPVWLDQRELWPRAGAARDALIAEAIRTCVGLLFVMTPDSVAPNSVCKREWKRALQYKRPIVPLKLHPDVETPLRLQSRRCLDFTGDFDTALAQLRTHLTWLESPAGRLQALKHQLEDAQRDLRREIDRQRRARIEVNVARLEQEIARLEQEIARLEQEIAHPDPPLPDPVPEPRALRVFLCHSSGDKPAVRDLYRRLRADGVKPWLDEEDLLPGQDWNLEIRRAVADSDIVLVCLSRASVTKVGFVQKEIGFVLDRAEEQPEGTIFLIPLRLEDCEVPQRLGRWQRVDLFEEAGYPRLRLALQSRARPVGA